MDPYEAADAVFDLAFSKLLELAPGGKEDFDAWWNEACSQLVAKLEGHFDYDGEEEDE
jgi:hypothetical protein